MAFLTVNNFFCGFSKIRTKRTFVRLLFLKLNQGRNRKKTNFWGGFLQNPKTYFLGVQNGTFQKSNFKFVFLRLFFNVKGSSMPIFIKKILIFGPLEFYENEHFVARAPACAKNLDLDF